MNALRRVQPESISYILRNIEGFASKPPSTTHVERWQRLVGIKDDWAVHYATATAKSVIGRMLRNSIDPAWQPEINPAEVEFESPYPSPQSFDIRIEHLVSDPPFWITTLGDRRSSTPDRPSVNLPGTSRLHRNISEKEMLGLLGSFVPDEETDQDAANRILSELLPNLVANLAFIRKTSARARSPGTERDKTADWHYEALARYCSGETFKEVQQSAATAAGYAPAVIPGKTLESALADLRKLIALSPKHPGRPRNT